jgi:geranylgeranyl diphosphate synthase type II
MSQITVDAAQAARADTPAGGRRFDFFEQTLIRYRDIAVKGLLDLIPEEGPRYLYQLIPVYPSRMGKGLRAALCFATCEAMGGSPRQALNSAIAIELFHNAFLIHDDIQDASEMRRGGPTLYKEHGIGVAVNVGNGTNLMGLQRLISNRSILGPQVSWRIMEETEQMMRLSLEGQAIELGWIRDNACSLRVKDYLKMSLKKTSWYSFIYPMRVGALVAGSRVLGPDAFTRFGWYFGAAFQIQDDLLNLTGSYEKYGKEILGDLWEGKRTLMVIHLLNHCTEKERRNLKRFLGKARDEREQKEVERVFDLMQTYGSLEFARKSARQLAGAALLEAVSAFRGVPDSESKQFILDMVLYVVNRDK